MGFGETWDLLLNNLLAEGSLRHQQLSLLAGSLRVP